MRFHRAALVIACSFALASTLSAQDGAKTTSESPKEFKALKYRNIGPAAGGRVSRAVGVPGNPLIYYAATASGGVWMSSDGGTKWQTIIDDEPNTSIG
jgi:hypothetical protein